MFAIANSIILLHYKYSFFPQHKGFKLSKSLKIGLRIPSHITCVRPETFAPGLYWGFPTAVFLIITHIGWVPRISEAFFFFLVLFALNAWCFYADFLLPVYNLLHCMVFFLGYCHLFLLAFIQNWTHGLGSSEPISQKLAENTGFSFPVVFFVSCRNGLVSLHGFHRNMEP